MRKLLVGLIAALAFPAGAHAADSLYLSLDRTKIAPGWWLGGSVVSAEAYAPTDILGLTLTRPFAGGQGEESHALRANHERSTLAFDGRNGRWLTTGQLGSVAVIDMRIAPAGAAMSVDALLGCRGALTRTPVRLTGTLVLRTGTRFFRAIRRVRLTGAITSSSGALDCKVASASECVESSSLYAGSPQASLNASRRSLVLQFSEALRASALGTVNWYHVLRAEGYDALIGTPPELTAVASRGLGMSGSATFMTRSTTNTTSGACSVTRAEGVAAGSFSARFTGWGARTLRLGPRAFAEYRESE